MLRRAYRLRLSYGCLINTIFPLWEDMRTDAALSGCSGFPGGTCGIFTSVSGVAPNRIFNIEWRTVLFGNNASRQNFEARLYENSVGLTSALT